MFCSIPSSRLPPLGTLAANLLFGEVHDYYASWHWAAPSRWEGCLHTARLLITTGFLGALYHVHLDLFRRDRRAAVAARNLRAAGLVVATCQRILCLLTGAGVLLARVLVEQVTRIAGVST